jgi:hypothetical protein
LKGNPFEHYVAETEPDIAEYAVKPPYFEAIDTRALNTSSYVLFGDRGAGKSATRLTIFKQIWAKKAHGERVPLVVNLIDFSSMLNRATLSNLSEEALIKEVAFVVIESLLTWLSSLDDSDRLVYVEGLNEDESLLCFQMLRDYYLSRPEQKRYRSVREAMLLFNQAFLAKSKLWIDRRWDPIARLISTIMDSLSRRYIGTQTDLAGDINSVITRSDHRDVDSVLVLRKLVDFVSIFDLSGVVTLVDKVDKTAATNNSADQTAALVHPLLSRVQLMEVAGFS